MRNNSFVLTPAERILGTIQSKYEITKMMWNIPTISMIFALQCAVWISALRSCGGGSKTDSWTPLSNIMPTSWSRCKADSAANGICRSMVENGEYIPCLCLSIVFLLLGCLEGSDFERSKWGNSQGRFSSWGLHIKFIIGKNTLLLREGRKCVGRYRLFFFWRLRTIA